MSGKAEQYFYIQQPVAVMREFPSYGAQVVSQAFFSEQVEILDQEGEWTLLLTLIDHYSGWVHRPLLAERTKSFPQKNRKIATVNRLAAHLYSHQDTIYGPILSLPFESQLEVIEEAQAPLYRWIKVCLPNDEEYFIQSGDVILDKPLLSCHEMCQFSHRFLGIPYTWGGRSSFGFDCSGYVQMLYRQMGIYLPRDSKDQIKCLQLQSVEMNDLQQGDLLFFGTNLDKVFHVGLYLSEQQFIHTVAAVENSPYVRYSSLTDPIWNGSATRGCVGARRLIK